MLLRPCGATVDGIAKDADGDKGDALLASSGAHKRAPDLTRQRCREKPWPPMGPGWPLAGSAGGSRVAQRVDQRGAVRQRSHGQFYPGSGRREA